MAKASDNTFPKLIVSEGTTPSSPAAGSQKLFIDSADHKLKRVNSSGTVTTVEGSGGGSGQGLVDFARAKRTAGDVTVNSTTFTNVDTGLDLVISASAGDVIEARLSAKITKGASGATYFVFDFCTVVGGSPVNSISAEAAAGTGLSNSFPGWSEATVLQQSGTVPYTAYAGSKRYVVQAGDISGGTVTLRLRAFCGASCTIKASDPMLYVEATNLGPQL